MDDEFLPLTPEQRRAIEKFEPVDRGVVLESIRSMTREELGALLSEGMASGSTDAVRGLLAFAKGERRRDA